MLVLTRRVNQSIIIGSNIKITVVDIKKDGNVRIGITAPRSVSIHRQEVFDEIQKENVASSMVDTHSMEQLGRLMKSIED